VKVTPSSKVVGDLAIFLVSHGMKVANLEHLGADHSLTLPNSVIEMFSGSLGVPEGGWPRKLQSVILRGVKPQRGRPSAHLKPADLDGTRAALESELGRTSSKAEVLSFLLYPDVFRKFAQAQQAYGDVEVLPTPQFFFGMEQGEEITVEIEPGKTLIIKFLAV